MKCIGKYVICGLLGRGGMSVVYKARLPVVNKIVALKLLSPHPSLTALLGESEVRRRFEKEAASLGALRHPNLVEVLDFDYAQGRPFFTMEFYYRNLGLLMGESYRVEQLSRILSLDKTIHYARHILLGLSRLHRAGMVHRDIKPYNLLTGDEDQLKIGDFGLSKLRGETSHYPSNLVVGSPYYAAPEQERDPEGVDERADLYSTAVVIYRMLTGHLPEEGAPRPSACHPDADSSWDDFIAAGAAPRRADRFESAGAMLKALEDLRAAWERRKKGYCRGLERETRERGPRQTGVLPVHLRERPLKLSPAEAPAVFGCDGLWRPAEYIENDFQSLPDGVVLDGVTGLLWQRSGSEDPLDWRDAHRYVESLNERRHAGRADWRLPTVNELYSLLKPLAHGEEHCGIESVFEQRGSCLWSGDRRSFNAAWYLDADLGFAGYADFHCRHHIRAVCRHGKSMTSKP